ncbi:non-ribosomal peptide synthetase [Pedobacter steynii]|uniref:Carrier domain-containing protein n=1 Tax=Pedobacter steynii TaxID=430522 RepID=A0A1D7QND1_9SPHI|nr:non-ribosomal peptide synthetase [Pedobacter steynii]AOM80164.1 hypothetical protein BFS30_25185 [Pedobacter steynii]
MIFQNELLKSFTANGDRIAVESARGSVTYTELQHRANAITNFLIAQNVLKGSNIGVHTHRPEEIIVCMIGIMNAGCVFVPINPDLPVRRKEEVLNEVSPAYIFGGKSTDTGINTIDIDLILNQKSADQSTPIYPEFDQDDSIYIYFTSGSTGKPKGIIGRNKSLLQYLQWQINEFSIDQNCRVSQLISPYFDAFLRDVFVPLLTGGTICLPPEEEDLFTPLKMVSWLNEAGVTIVHCVPSVFQIINEGAPSATLFPSLSYIFMSGEKINPLQLAKWYATFNDRISLVNLYGATETTMVRCFYRIQPEDSSKSKISIGNPIADTQLFILDENGIPCSKYIVGDLYIASTFISKGYLNNEALNKEKFITLFKGTAKEVPAFKTGDKARFTGSGKVELLGRDDRQVKIRGIRVDLEEIEYILLRSGFLKNALVFLGNPELQDESAGQSADPEILTAFVIRNDAEADDEHWAEKLKNKLKEHLPEDLIPAKIIVVDSYPLLPNGKINYPELSALSLQKEIIAPKDEIEQRLLAIWVEILGQKEVSTIEKFHEAGGNSLSIMRLIAKIYKEFNVRVVLKDLFNNLTIQKQAVLIRSALKDESLHIATVGKRDFYPASIAQERIYYLYLSDKSGITFNLPMAWELSEEVDTERLKSAIRSLVIRHESLRTYFNMDRHRINQLIEDGSNFEITEVPVAADFSLSDFIKPFDLDNGPLFRCFLIYPENGKTILFTDAHHIICDGMSQVNLFADLLQFYNGKDLDLLPIQYKDYSVWEQQFRTSPEYLNCRKFWVDSYKGELPSLKWPVRDQPQDSSYGSNLLFYVPSSDLLPLLDQWKQEGVSVFSGLLSAYFLFLSQLYGQEDLIIGINSSGRMQSELENVVGMFAKTLPVRYEIDLDDTYLQFVGKIQAHLRELLNYQQYDYSDILSDINRDHDFQIGQLFDTMLVFQNFEHSEAADERHLFTPHVFESGAAKYPMSLFVYQNGDGFQFRMEYLTSYFTEEDILMLSEQFIQLLKLLVANSETPLKSSLNADQVDPFSKEDLDFRF